MKKINILIIAIICIFIEIIGVEAKNVDVYLFHSDSCPHCAKEREYLESIKKDEGLNIHYYEVSEFANITDKVRDNLSIGNSYVPLTIIGSDYIIGFSDNTKKEIEELIDSYRNTDYCSVVKVILSDGDVDECIKQNQGIYLESDEKIVPILGKINIKTVSLPILSIVIGFVDGFNPCAMWVLIFLISMLFNMKNRKKMWILGLTFIFFSAIVYLFFMMAWLKLATTMLSTWFKYIIALVALMGGFINIRSYLNDRKKEAGCQVTSSTKRKKIMGKIQKIVNEKSFILALLGIMALAFSINLIELACSAGLPVLFTQILAINHLSVLEYSLYIFLYLLFFIIDDLIIFIIAMVTLKITGISNKYTKYSHLIGGIIMLIIGLLMAFKTDWLMFNF
ncbi:MAG: hypothetical protein IJR82_05490 [Bacilli bacterium]|nr:hypothetical protein [Bacilli bacterium]